MRPGSAVVVGVALWIAVPAAVAQEREFGAKAGPSFAVLNVDPADSDVYSRRIAIAGGGYAVWPVSRRVGVQIELLQMPKGTTLETGGSVGTSKLLLDYLDIPVLARLTAPGSRAFHVFAGPYVGFRLRAKLESKFETTGTSVNVGTRQDVREGIKRYEAGVVAGAGVHIGRHGLIDGRYAWGLTDVNADKSQDVRIKNRVFAIMAGVRF